MFSIFEFWTTWHIIYAVIVGIIGLGFALTCAVGLMKGLLWLFGSTHRLGMWLWQRLTGKAPTSHGSAHWATAQEIEAKGLFTPGPIPLATWQGKPIYEALGAHVALVAPPRSFKSVSFVAPLVAGFPGSTLTNDPRGELWARCHVAREAHGPTYRFSPTQKDSCSINVLDAVRWGEPEAFGDVQRVVHGLLSPDPGEDWNDFRLEAKPLLEAIVHDRHAAGEGHLPGVVRWMTAPGASMKQKAEALLSSPLLAVASGGRRFLDKSDRLQSSVWSAALSALTIYQDPLVAEHTERSDVELRELQHGLQPVSIFMCPEFADVPRLRSLLGTLTEMLSALFSAQQDTPRQKVLLALDEMGNLGRLEGLARGLSFLQGCGCQILQVWQNVLQVRTVYGHDSPILAGCGTAVYYCPGDQETAAFLSEELGVTTAQLHPETQHRSFWGLLTSFSIGTSEHRRALMTPDECRRLGESQAIIISKGLSPMLAQKLGAVTPEIIDVASPIWRKVAAVVGALALVGSLGAWGLWPRSPVPTLALTTETRAMTLPPVPPRAEVDAPPRWQPSPGEVRAPTATEAPGQPGWGTYTSPEDYAEAVAIVLPHPDAGKPWRLASQGSRDGPIITIGSSMSALPSGRFATQHACQVSLHEQAERTIRLLRSQAASQRGMRLEVANTPNFVSWTLNPGHAWTEQHRAAWCYLAMEEE